MFLIDDKTRLPYLAPLIAPTIRRQLFDNQQQHIMIMRLFSQVVQNDLNYPIIYSV